ncbi:hypothetical protein ACJJTC_017884 [Scirpophaga incertulas]
MPTDTTMSPSGWHVADLTSESTARLPCRPIRDRSGRRGGETAPTVLKAGGEQTTAVHRRLLNSTVLLSEVLPRGFQFELRNLILASPTSKRASKRADQLLINFNCPLNVETETQFNSTRGGIKVSRKTDKPRDAELVQFYINRTDLYDCFSLGHEAL